MQLAPGDCKAEDNTNTICETAKEQLTNLERQEQEAERLFDPGKCKPANKMICERVKDRA